MSAAVTRSCRRQATAGGDNNIQTAGSLIPMTTHLRSLDRAGVIVGVLLALGAAQAATNTLPDRLMQQLGSASVRGFVVRSVQAGQDATITHGFSRAIQQLNGTLLDSTGAEVANEATPGGNADGSYDVDVINFEKDATPIDIADGDGNVLGSFAPEMFPGIPGAGGHTDNFAIEVVGFLELSAGLHTFGVGAGADRTDVNDDDSFAAFVSENPRDYFGFKVGDYERSARAFVTDQHIETQFSVVANAAGIYPFRLVYWQRSRGANLQFYEVNPDTGERILVNDAADPRAIVSYRQSTVAIANAPYLAEVSPVPGSDGNSPSAPVTALIVDGQTTASTAKVLLNFNGVKVTPQSLSKTGGRIRLAYAPNATRADKNSLVSLIYTDSAAAAYSHNWSFGIVPSGGSATVVTGQWDFDAGDLSATVGAPLEYFDGPTGMTATKTRFGTTTDLGVADIAGKAARVMQVPGDLSRSIGYVMKHGIAPNGGGTKVNQFTLIMDVMVATSGPGAASLLQTSSLNNTDDGDLFWQGNNFGQGSGGYNGTGQFTAGGWHRIVAAYDEAATPPVVTKFVDGIKQDDWTANQGLDAPRRALQATAILFGDGDQDERRVMWVNSVQIRSGKLSDAEAVALGGPSTDGIPQVIPPTSVTGQWDFDRGDLSATVGKPLQYFDGADGLTKNSTVFGTTADLGVADINGEVARVMMVPGDLTRDIGYIMDHGIKPNGGGTKVNQYTLIMDIMVDTSGPGAASLLQISSLNNTDDGDLFWQGSNFGQGTGGYNGTGQFSAGGWHRIVAAYDEAATPPVVTKFVDGIKQDDWTANQGLDAPRRALLPTAILFGDGDQDERRVMWVNSIQIRAGKMTDAEAVLLGGPSAKGIPVVVAKSTVTGQWDFNRGDLSATVGKPLQYFDGPNGATKAGTVFGTTTDMGVPDIEGLPAQVMRVSGDLTREIGYIMDHGIKPNGGGTKVNQYTLVMDILVDTSGPGAASLLQISSLNNTDDGDLFWQGNNFGQGGGGYNGTGQFTAGEWHRIAAAYDEAAAPPVVTKFVDGIKQDDWTANQGLDAPRRALQPTAILFGDGDQDERRVMWVNSIQIRAGKLSDAELAALGGPTAAGIPLVIKVEVPVERPRLVVSASGASVTLSWTSPVTNFVLESTQSLTNPEWTPVPGVVNNSVTLSISGGNRFFRLKLPLGGISQG